jgi:alpha-glucosidase (family GH31 glycosyl hydrolase)
MQQQALHYPLVHCRLLFKDQYLELTTALPADADLYGLGEVSLPTGLLLPRDGTIITMWARDYSSAAVNANLYGAHPFYLQVNKGEKSGSALCLCKTSNNIAAPRTEQSMFVIYLAS